MELTKFTRLLRKWFWIVILGAILGAGASFLANINRMPLYQATTKILIGGFIQSPNPDTRQIDTGSWLAETYTQLVTLPNVLQGTIDALQLPLTVRELSQMVMAGKPIETVPMLLIQVTNSDPQLAVNIANEVTRQLILNSPSNLTPAQQSQIDLANSQIDILNQQVQDALAELSEIDAQLALVPGSENQNSPLTQQRNALIDQINQATANIAQFTATTSELQQRTNSLEVVEHAQEAVNFSTGPGRLESMVLSTVVGIVLALAAIFLIDFFDNTISTSKQASLVLGLPVLGTIGRLGKRGASYPDRLITRRSANSPILEAYRALQINLLAPEVERGGVYIITSPFENEGKSVTAANLAVTMASNDLQVLLIDADLRKPTLHEIFGLKNQSGLTTLLSTLPEIDTSRLVPGYEITSANERKTMQTLSFCVQQTSIPNLRVITSGPAPDNPAKVLGSGVAQQWIDIIRAMMNVSVVLFDTPPCLGMADTSILAASLKADCILVLEAGRTRRDAALSAQQQFTHVGCNVKGIILNKVKLYDADHGYNSGYQHVQLPEMQNGKHPSNSRNQKVTMLDEVLNNQVHEE
jgi:polysaccharide biosynthesis transport protein